MVRKCVPSLDIIWKPWNCNCIIWDDELLIFCHWWGSLKCHFLKLRSGVSFHGWYDWQVVWNLTIGKENYFTMNLENDTFKNWKWVCKHLWNRFLILALLHINFSVTNEEDCLPKISCGRSMICSGNSWSFNEIIPLKMWYFWKSKYLFLGSHLHCIDPDCKHC